MDLRTQVISLLNPRAKVASSTENVERSVQAVNKIAQGILDDSLRDVVSGFGILHEPFSNCGS